MTHSEDCLTNHPAASKAGFATRLAIGHHWSGLSEPGPSSECERASVTWKGARSLYNHSWPQLSR